MATQSSSATARDDLLYSIKAWEDAVSGSSNKDLRVDSFELGRTIGKGRFARVRLVKLKANKTIPLCLKILKKKDIHRLEQVSHIINEKDVLASSRHPFIIQMLQTFQDAVRLYMALELVNGGELFTLLRSQRTFKQPMAVFYVAELASAIRYLHEMLIVYRDIKPENILIHRSGHLKLTDFGFAKYLKNERTYTVCGTAAYMAPEIIRSRGAGYGLAVDWWAVGILTFELMSGRPPFDATTEEEIYRLILKGHAQYPPVMEKSCREFIMRLLTADPTRRLGHDDLWTNFREHAFFTGIDWEDVDAGRLEPPWKPSVGGDIFNTSLFEHFEESAGGANGAIDSCTASSFLAPEQEDPFLRWNEAQNLREEALQVAQQKQEKREKRREAKRKEAEAEAAEMERLNRERDAKKKAELEQVKIEEKKPQAKPAQGCCALQ